MKATVRTATGVISCVCGIVQAVTASDPPNYVESSLLRDKITEEGYVKMRNHRLDLILEQSHEQSG